jgi:hypothetical protein
MGAIDLLKNKGLDITISVVLCLILKLFLRLDKLGTKGPDKNLNSCPSLNHDTTFVLCTSCLKYKIIFCPSNIVQRQNLSNTLNFVLYCSVLYYHILFCPVLTFYGYGWALITNNTLY